jgi:hypothetical protein
VRWWFASFELTPINPFSRYGVFFNYTHLESDKAGYSFPVMAGVLAAIGGIRRGINTGYQSIAKRLLESSLSVQRVQQS